MPRLKKLSLIKTPFSSSTLLFVLVFAVLLSGCMGPGRGGFRSNVSPPPVPATMSEGGVTTPQVMNCPDGSTVPIGSQCPPDHIVCPAGGSVPAGQDCPPLPTLDRSQLSYVAMGIPELVEDFLGAAGAMVSFGTRGGIGHTTQSSNITSDGYTGERVDFGAEYDEYGELHFTRTRRTASRTYTSSTKDSDVFMHRLYGVPVVGWQGVETWAEYPAAFVYWDAYSNIAYPQAGEAKDPNYLTLAYWLIVLKDENTGGITGYNLGASASGNDPYEFRHLTGLRGTATYEGPATGLYMRREYFGAPVYSDYFNAKATLTADFGDASMPGTISGAITEGMTDEGYHLPEVSLGSADIAESFHGGNFRGDTSGVTFWGVALSGTWGGKFFGNGACTTGISVYCPHPLSVAGTFGTGSEDGLESILGAFGAEFKSATTPVLTGRDILLSAIAEHPEEVGDNAAMRILRAARSSPSFGTREGIGHTTQSSYSFGGRTSDKMDFTAEYDESGDLHFTATRRFIDSSRVSIIDTKEGGALLKRLDGVPAADWKGVERRQVTSEYDFSMDIYSDLKHGADMDYLSMGYWLISYKDAETGKYTGYTLGAAASGNYPFPRENLARLTGRATYEGPATGLYMRRQNVAAAAGFDYFNAKASLTAEFGDETALGSISGAITEGMTDGGLTLPELTLGSADITDTHSGGNFRGDTAGMTNAGVALAGAWGGKFFVDDSLCTTAIPPSCSAPHPLSVAGTFGANGEDNLQSILGAFGAELVASTPTPTVDNIRQLKVAEAARNTGGDAYGHTGDIVQINIRPGPPGGESYTAYYNGVDVVTTDLGTAFPGAGLAAGFPAGTRLHERFSRPEYQGTIFGRSVDFYRNLGQAESARIGNVAGTIWLSIHTDYDNGERGPDSTVDNHIAVGRWYYAPADPYRFHDYEIGAFADGNDPFHQENLASVAGTFNYVGNNFVTGFYTDAVNGIYETFSADALLTAEFGGSGGLGTISGHIRNYVVGGRQVTGYPELLLQSAHIGEVGSGFFIGDTSGQAGGSLFSGYWGGQFFGNGSSPTDPPTAVAGTFGASTVDWGIGILGSFGAYAQLTDPEPEPDPMPDPDPGVGWSDSEWVAIFAPDSPPARPWFGSDYQLHYTNSQRNHLPRGEITGSRDCFLQNSLLFDCYDNAEFVPYTKAPFTGVKLPAGISMARARGHFDNSDEEEVGAIFGFTEYGYWAVGWTENAGDAYSETIDHPVRSILSEDGENSNFVIEAGELKDYEKTRERLEYLPDRKQTWSASYAGQMSGIAHNFGNRPVGGNVAIQAEFDWLNTLNSVNMRITDIRGSGLLRLPDIQFPIIDGDCCNENKPNGSIGVTSFELVHGGRFLDGEFVGPAHNAVHGVFSTGSVSGAFGAVQTNTQNRPPLER